MTTPTIITLTVAATCAVLLLANTRAGKGVLWTISVFTWMPYWFLWTSRGGCLAEGLAQLACVVVIILQFVF